MLEKVETEELLVQLFVDSYCRAATAGTGVKVFTELKTGWGRPDVTVVKYDTDRISRRIDGLFPRSPRMGLSEVGGLAMSFLAQVGESELVVLGEELGLGPARIQRACKELESRNLISRVNSIIRPNPIQDTFVVQRVEVFEAKLTNWRVAIKQAQRHLWFAGQGSIVLPLLSDATWQMVASQCSRAGIGLISHRVDGTFEEAVRPSELPLSNSPMLWRINENVVDEVLSVG
ncbi:MAG: hypothetical protein WAU88_15055 [Candidatus Zixiibacteriota bacterium]